jgi:Ala-tRNA(Pro) deacylase
LALAKTVQSCLVDNEVEFELLDHPRSYTSVENAHAAHVPEDHVAKAVMLHDARGFVMAVIPGDCLLKLDTLGSLLNRDLEMADEEKIDAVFDDCQPGAVPPLGPAYGLETVADPALQSLSRVYFEAGDHEELVSVDGGDFRKLLAGVRWEHIARKR